MVAGSAGRAEADGSITDSFSVTKGSDPALFEDDFESGNLSAWTQVVE